MHPENEVDISCIELTSSKVLYWTIIGMDCASCARKIENSIKSLPEIEQVRVVYSTEKLIVHTQNPTDVIRTTIEKRVQTLGFDLYYHGQNQTQSYTTKLNHHTVNKKAIFSILGLGGFIALSFIISWYRADFAQYAFIITTSFGLVPI